MNILLKDTVCLSDRSRASKVEERLQGIGIAGRLREISALEDAMPKTKLGALEEVMKLQSQLKKLERANPDDPASHPTPKFRMMGE